MAKTALELTQQEWQEYQPAQVVESRYKAEKFQNEQRRETAWQVARQAARLLRQEFGADRVVVFGSLVYESEFNQWSDIDLAAWGIPPDRFFSAVAAVTSLSSQFSVDLVDPETCHRTLTEAIEQNGLQL
jgi:predicted nucleotidyltransferase